VPSLWSCEQAFVQNEPFLYPYASPSSTELDPTRLITQWLWTNTSNRTIPSKQRLGFRGDAPKGMLHGTLRSRNRAGSVGYRFDGLISWMYFFWQQCWGKRTTLRMSFCAIQTPLCWSSTTWRRFVIFGYTKFFCHIHSNALLISSLRSL
jgi:hypothetical protein